MELTPQQKRSLKLSPEGTVYGRLTVVENKGTGICRCLCACGKQVEASARLLRAGQKRSCGCLRRETTAALNAAELIQIGSSYGRLTVLEAHAKRCRCSCSCGKEVVVAPAKLRSGHTQSCGCLQKDRARESAVRPLTVGEKRHKLTFVRQEGRRVICQCTCGNSTSIDRRKFGHTKSCGCLDVEHARELAAKRTIPGSASAGNSLYTFYRAQAHKRGLAFTLSRELFRQLLAGDCCYCGCSPQQMKRNFSGAGRLVYNGVDRYDSSQGYVPENCVTACGICNRAKHEGSGSDFKAYVAQLSARFNSNTLPRLSDLSLDAHTGKLPNGYSQARHKASARKLAFEIPAEHFAYALRQPCSYCGDTSSGLDRVDNKLGYTLDNVTPCCARCNWAKHRLDIQAFAAWINRFRAQAKP